MSNPWSGMFTKTILSKRRSRKFWNIFLISILVIIVFSLSSLSYVLLNDYYVETKEYTFISYENNFVITNERSFEVARKDRQEIEISRLVNRVSSGETVEITIGKITKELIEIKFNKETVYKKELVPILPNVLGCIFLIFPVLTFLVFLFIVVNIKKVPNKFIDNLQKKMILRKHD